MSGPIIFQRQCPTPDCDGWFEWSEWTKDPNACTCDSCGKTMGQVNIEEQERHDRELLRGYHKWLHEKHNLGEDMVMGPLSIERYLRARGESDG